jgi:hypothetical protein
VVQTRGAAGWCGLRALTFVSSRLLLWVQIPLCGHLLGDSAVFSVSSASFLATGHKVNVSYTALEAATWAAGDKEGFFSGRPSLQLPASLVVRLHLWLNL